MEEVVGQQVVLTRGIRAVDGDDVLMRKVPLELGVERSDGSRVPGGDLPEEDLSDDRRVQVDAADALSVVAVEVVHERQPAGHVGQILVGLRRVVGRLLGAVGDVRGGEVELVLGKVVEPDNRRGHLPVDVEPEQGRRLAHPLLDGHTGEARAGRLHRRACPGRHQPYGLSHGGARHNGGDNDSRPHPSGAAPIRTGH